jgi:hypothetical protein
MNVTGAASFSQVEDAGQPAARYRVPVSIRISATKQRRLKVSAKSAEQEQCQHVTGVTKMCKPTLAFPPTQAPAAAGETNKMNPYPCGGDGRIANDLLLAVIIPVFRFSNRQKMDVLTMSEDVRNDALPRFDLGYIQNSLGHLVGIFQKSGKVETYTELAEKLSAIAHKEIPWGWRYVQSVHTGSVAASEKFSNAVEILMASLDGLPAFIAETEPITVYARPGAIHPNSVILGESKTCANPTCTIHFVPRVPWQKYCPNCKGKKHYGK